MLPLALQIPPENVVRYTHPSHRTETEVVEVDVTSEEKA